MTTPSTTALVDGTPDRVSTSSATSMDGEEGSSELNATRRHHLEQLAVPSIRIQSHWPSARSFNSSLDRMNDDADNDHTQQTPRQQYIDGEGSASATLNDGAYNTSNHPRRQDGTSQETSPSRGRAAIRREIVIHQNTARNGYPSQVSDISETTATHAPSNGLDHSMPSQSHGSIPPLTTRQSNRSSSQNTRTTPNNDGTHPHPHRRRLVDWLRRRLDHPLPWNLSLRRRAENVRRRIRDVDRLFS
ncbi:MAG: hypothetical protein L6R40_004711 [Gallowayella cf. fulva]|nr:MAG: hypothetical protein L6R40_004711 [Xanthomendoza cf. fulva]